MMGLAKKFEKGLQVKRDEKRIGVESSGAIAINVGVGHGKQRITTQSGKLTI